MYEIKGFVRPEVVDRVVHALHDAGIPQVTTTHVRSMGRAGTGLDPQHRALSVEAGMWYSDMVKVEVVCVAGRLDALLATIRGAARTGQPGDGLLFVIPVARVVKVRTGEEGQAVLQ